MGGGGGGGLGAGGALFIGAGASAALDNVNFAGDRAIGGDGGRSYHRAQPYDVGAGWGGLLEGHYDRGLGVGGRGDNGNTGAGGGGVGAGGGGGYTFLNSIPFLKPGGAGGYAGGTGGTGAYRGFFGGGGGGGAGLGGGVFVMAGGSLTISNGSFSGNSATGGGGGFGHNSGGAGVGLGGALSTWQRDCLRPARATLIIADSIAGSGIIDHGRNVIMSGRYRAQTINITGPAM